MTRALAIARLGLLVFVAQLASAAAEPKTALGPSVLSVPVEQRKIEQGILTPVPIAIDLPEASRARRVLVHFKTWGWPEWSTLELKRVGSTRFIGAIPCLEVSTITGDLVYYVRVHDADGAVIAYSGSRAQPYRVTVVHDSLRPGAAEAPGRCPDPADCPAGLPGCPSETVERVPCKRDDDCEGGMSCGWDGYCTLDQRRKNWLSLEVAQEIGVVPTAGACTVTSQETEGYACYRQTDGDNYIGDPIRSNEPLAAGFGQTRLLVGYERLVYYTTSAGVRLGYALRGSGPTLPGGTEFLPWYGELRVTHWFGFDPFDAPRLRPFVSMSAGFSMFDVKVESQVREDVSRPSAQGDNELEQPLDVWRRAGSAFVGLGGGVTVPLTEAFSASAQLMVLEAFPYGALIVQPAIGARAGF